MLPILRTVALILCCFLCRPGLLDAKTIDDSFCEWALSDQAYLSRFNFERWRIKLSPMSKVEKFNSFSDYMVEKLRLQTQRLTQTESAFFTFPSSEVDQESHEAFKLKVHWVVRGDSTWNLKAGTKVWIVDINGHWQSVNVGDTLLVHQDSHLVVAAFTMRNNAPDIRLFSKFEIFQ